MAAVHAPDAWTENWFRLVRSRYTYSAALRPGRQSAFRPLRRALYGPISTAWGPCRTRLIAPRAPSSCSSGPLTCCTQSHTAWFARFALLRYARGGNADKSAKQTPTDEHSAPIVRKLVSAHLISNAQLRLAAVVVACAYCALLKARNAEHRPGTAAPKKHPMLRLRLIAPPHGIGYLLQRHLGAVARSVAASTLIRPLARCSNR